MALFRFIGDPRHDGNGAERIEAFGLSFERVHATEVADARVIAKLAGNSHFMAVEADVAPARAAPPAPVAPLDGRKRRPRGAARRPAAAGGAA
jgi:hypothetical protein